MTALVVAIHVASVWYAGALWRDEVNSVNVASMSARELVKNLQFDSFPVVFFGVLRLWITSGAGASDAGLRIFGLLAGLAILGAAWWNARRLGAKAPLLSIALLGFNPAVVLYGDSLRGYGVGMLTGLVAFGTTWSLVERPGPRRFIVAGAAALVSVQCLFYNSVIVLAACAGGAAVALRRRDPKLLGWLAAAGALAALSMLPYRSVLLSQASWNVIVKAPIELSWIWVRFVQAASLAGAHAPAAWLATTGLAAACALWLLVRPGAAVPARLREATLYCWIALVVGVPAYVLFLFRLSYPMQPWYLLALMLLLAVTIDGILRRPRTAEGPDLLRMGVAALLALLAIGPTWQAVRVRKTNLDLVAREIGRVAAREDFVVVSPWYNGITFARYYRGPADWTTIPPMSDHAVHRYDLLKQAMMRPESVDPLMTRLEATVRAGHRVFWVGGPQLPPPGEAAPALPPAPTRWGWREDLYYRGWTLQAGQIVNRNAAPATPLPVPASVPVQSYENVPVTVVQGRREG